MCKAEAEVFSLKTELRKNIEKNVDYILLPTAKYGQVSGPRAGNILELSLNKVIVPECK